MNSAKMNSKTHKIITARWVSDGLQHFVVPIDWEIEDIEIGYGLLSYKGEEKPYIPEKFIECTEYEPIDSIEEADWEDVAGYFSCCESEEEVEEYAVILTDENGEVLKKSNDEDEEEEEEKPDIVFHCESCKKPIVRDSEDHDFSKCHEEKWYCVDCPCEEEEEEEEEEERYCDNEKCPYEGYCFGELKEQFEGKPYICEGCSTGIGVQEKEQEEEEEEEEE